MDSASDSENSFIPSDVVLQRAISDLREGQDQVASEGRYPVSQFFKIHRGLRNQRDGRVETIYDGARHINCFYESYRQIFSRRMHFTFLLKAIQVQLDILETIAKLLHKNKHCQAEFLKIDGYSYLVSIFDCVPTTLVEEEAYLFLQVCQQS
jgi:hypothetical protein